MHVIKKNAGTVIVYCGWTGGPSCLATIGVDSTFEYIYFRKVSFLYMTRIIYINGKNF